MQILPLTQSNIIPSDIAYVSGIVSVAELIHTASYIISKIIL